MRRHNQLTKPEQKSLKKFVRSPRGADAKLPWDEMTRYCLFQQLWDWSARKHYWEAYVMRKYFIRTGMERVL